MSPTAAAAPERLLPRSPVEARLTKGSWILYTESINRASGAGSIGVERGSEPCLTQPRVKSLIEMKDHCVHPKGI